MTSMDQVFSRARDESFNGKQLCPFILSGEGDDKPHMKSMQLIIFQNAKIQSITIHMNKNDSVTIHMNTILQSHITDILTLTINCLNHTLSRRNTLPPVDRC